MVQYSNRAKTCQQSETETKSQTCHKSKNTAKILEPNPVTSEKKTVQYLNIGKTCQLSEKVRTKLEQSQNLITVRKRWYNSPTGSKTVIIKKNFKQNQMNPSCKKRGCNVLSPPITLESPNPPYSPIPLLLSSFQPFPSY